MSQYKNSDLQCFLEFLLSSKVNLLTHPIKGNISYIHQLFVKYLEANQMSSFIENLPSFLYYILQFNDISGCSLQFSRRIKEKDISDVSYCNTLQLANINKSKLLILNAKIGKSDAFDYNKFKESGPMGYNNPNDKLLSLLDESKLHTIVTLEDQLFDANFQTDFSTLNTLLKKPTAQKQLSKMKAKLISEAKPFYESCSNSNHNQALSNLLHKLKFTFHGLPSQFSQYNNKERFRKMLESHKHLVSQEVISCCEKKIHYLSVVQKHTELSLGDCSYLDTCHKMTTCRYLHYYTLLPLKAVEESYSNQAKAQSFEYTIGDCFTEHFRKIPPPQWIKCDVRHFPFPILGKFAAIISDPAWQIHMSTLPYGTCRDLELLELPMHELQDEGIILLWVTGRSIEIGRKALEKWGYRISDELIWVKLNQLRRTIVTGRTGHWLNHSKEHLLVGIKGTPIWLNKLMDMDVIVSGTRQTLRKPDEVYDMVERIVGKHARKLEIFGRDHNIRPGWLSTYFS